LENKVLDIVDAWCNREVSASFQCMNS